MGVAEERDPQNGDFCEDQKYSLGSEMKKKP